MENLLVVWHRCHRTALVPKQVRLDITKGAAYQDPGDGEWYWFPIYKDCCEFSYDKEFTQLIDTRTKSPQLTLDE